MKKIRVALRLVRGVYWGSLAVCIVLLLAAYMVGQVTLWSGVAPVVLLCTGIAVCVLGQVFCIALWKCPHCDSRFLMLQVLPFGSRCPGCGNDIFSEDPTSLIEVERR